jgi:hypothetical protein
MREKSEDRVSRESDRKEQKREEIQDEDEEEAIGISRW